MRLLINKSFSIMLVTLLLLGSGCILSKKKAFTAKDYSSYSFGLKTGSCYGKCAVYEFQINGNGMATFIGKENCSKEGSYTKALLPETMEELVKSFDEADFFEFNDEYDSRVTDLPTNFIEFSDGKQTKKIKNRFGAPNELKDLQKRLVEIANSDGWKKTMN